MTVLIWSSVNELIDQIQGIVTPQLLISIGISVCFHLCIGPDKELFFFLHKILTVSRYLKEWVSGK